MHSEQNELGKAKGHALLCRWRIHIQHTMGIYGQEKNEIKIKDFFTMK
jgi:hypothetical protein